MKYLDKRFSVSMRKRTELVQKDRRVGVIVTKIWNKCKVWVWAGIIVICFALMLLMEVVCNG